MTVPPPLATLLDASHRWGLERVREAIHAMPGHDRSLPELAERRVLEAPGAAGQLEARLYRPVGVAADAPLLLYFHGPHAGRPPLAGERLVYRGGGHGARVPFGFGVDVDHRH
jgi:hypothetical protein